VLDAQVNDFAARARFADAVLGLLSVTEQVRALAAAPATNPRPTGADAAAIADFLLGVISAGRTLRATLDGARPASRAAEPERPAPPDRPTDDRILR
jgi:hypothetical protein